MSSVTNAAGSAGGTAVAASTDNNTPPAMDGPSPEVASGAASTSPGAAGSAGVSTKTKTTEAQKAAMKTRYYELLAEKEEKKKKGGFKYMKKEKYDQAVHTLSNWVEGAGQSQKNYSLQRKFCIGGGTAEKCLYVKKGNKKVAIEEELFEIIYSAHDHLGHPRTSRTVKNRLDNTWYGVTEEVVQTLVDVCCHCTAAAKAVKSKQPPLQCMLTPKPKQE